MSRLQREHDPRYERAAVRWLGRLLVEKPRLGFAHAGEAIEALRDIDGAQPNVGRSRLSILLSSVGLDDAAQVVARA